MELTTNFPMTHFYI